MARPTAVPRIPASASGVSTQRSGPKRSRRPAVARKTPPARPTSSPMTITESSRSISAWSASLTASTSVRSLEAIAESREAGRRTYANSNTSSGSGRGQRLGCGDPDPHPLQRAGAGLLGELVREDAQPAQVALVAPEALVLALQLDAARIPVGGRVVGGRVGRAAVRQSLDERRPFSRACPRRAPRPRLRRPRARPLRPRGRRACRSRRPCRPASRRGSGPRAESRSPTGCCCRGERPARRMTAAKLAPSWNAPSEVAPSPKNASAHALFALQPRAPGEPDGVRDVGGDRHGDRRERYSRGSHQPAGWPAPPREHDLGRHPAEEPDRRLAIGGEDPVLVGEGVVRRPPASPRGPRRSRTCRSGPGGGRRASARRTCAAAPCCGRARGGPASASPSTSPSGTASPSPMTLTQVMLGGNDLGHAWIIPVTPRHENGERVPLRSRSAPPSMSPRSSPSTWSGVGPSHSMWKLVRVVDVEHVRRSRLPAPGQGPAREPAGGATAPAGAGRRGRGPARTAPPARSRSGTRPAKLYGSQFATRAKATRSRPSTVIAGPKRPRRRARMPASVRAKATSPARRPSRAAESVDTTDQLGVQPEARREGEPAAVDAPERDAPRPPVHERRAHLHRIAGQPERAREHARRAAGKEADLDFAPRCR